MTARVPSFDFSEKIDRAAQSLMPNLRKTRFLLLADYPRMASWAPQGMNFHFCSNPRKMTVRNNVSDGDDFLFVFLPGIAKIIRPRLNLFRLQLCRAAPAAEHHTCGKNLPAEKNDFPCSPWCYGIRLAQCLACLLAQAQQKAQYFL
jgi:hypothetical protein